ncbi:unnamed protein product [Cuscuta europaea]|uniref:Uncharacterized protein n=1 Tax=Cuscuta europaea TaxID=41803 RepID=A0A9P0ZGN3_CUSEU|nr:unnamed protein product [Cuscuta europaea]
MKLYKDDTVIIKVRQIDRVVIRLITPFIQKITNNNPRGQKSTNPKSQKHQFHHEKVYNYDKYKNSYTAGTGNRDSTTATGDGTASTSVGSGRSSGTAVVVGLTPSRTRDFVTI